MVRAASKGGNGASTAAAGGSSPHADEAQHKRTPANQAARANIVSRSLHVDVFKPADHLNCPFRKRLLPGRNGGGDVISLASL
jgi:hypothetical protein